ncbi:hypothetical protein PRUPE_1G031900 [Prunus persica]|uniref:Uncharacterized protein n=1 Tax=Prunus persica TaxID=3760 RepID=A0A251QV16_PRUPE|nr:hypothetical protein PRUPE_1G031900 [Prunus persica]
MLLCLVVLIQKNTDSFVELLMDTISSIEVIHANCQHLVSVSLFSLFVRVRLFSYKGILGSANAKKLLRNTKRVILCFWKH